MLKRMEENGLVKRTRSKEDERVVQVSLTDKGKEAEEKAAQIPFKFLEQTNLNKTELIHLKKILAKMLTQFE
ncbi:Winged helix DNA-binding domain-containing protein [Amphibacillus marinus]|uniref:HTH-type transcriptional regulator SarZ n=1 Tax=Amphibacillus marinus TaxID=872970 RepID=A0A1H8KYW5_9BACI|nr:Winged helix DNA-binding domain-containing protein [Amphibacillus marinus]